jgi:Tfp pilus assembly ATPase PilU
MLTMNQYLTALVRNGTVSKADALEHSFMADELHKMIEGISTSPPSKRERKG